MRFLLLQGRFEVTQVRYRQDKRANVTFVNNGYPVKRAGIRVIHHGLQKLSSFKRSEF